MKIFITGSTGFIGRHLIKQLQQLPQPNLNIIALVRDKNKIVEIPSPIQGAVGDILEPNTWQHLLEGVDVVIHLAAKVDFNPYNRAQVFEVNFTGTKNILEACERAAVKRLIFVSAAATIGLSESPDILLNENAPPPADLEKNPYTESKFKAERLCLSHKGYTKVVCLNPTTNFGVHDWSFNSGSIFKTALYLPIPLTFPGGTSYIAVEDTADAIITALTKGKPGERYIISGGNITYLDLFKTICEEAQKKRNFITIPKILYPIVFASTSVGNLILKILGKHHPLFNTNIARGLFKYKYFDTSKAHKELEWHPKISLKKAVKNALEFYRNEGFLK